MTNLNTPAGKRLKKYQTEAALSKWTTPFTWRDTKKHHRSFAYRSTLARSDDRSKIYVDSLEDFPGTIEGDAGDFTNLGHTGWYTDNFQDELLKGAVIAIHNPNVTDEDGSHKQYMPATYHSDWDGATVYNEFYDCKEDAARSADHYAEREAEDCREYDAKYQAEQEIERLKEELHDLNKETLALIKEVKETNKIFPKTVCELIREHIEEAVERRTAIFERIDALKDNFWLAVENW